MTLIKRDFPSGTSNGRSASVYASWRPDKYVEFHLSFAYADAGDVALWNDASQRISTPLAHPAIALDAHKANADLLRTMEANDVILRSKGTSAKFPTLLSTADGVRRLDSSWNLYARWQGSLAVDHRSAIWEMFPGGMSVEKNFVKFDSGPALRAFPYYAGAAELFCHPVRRGSEFCAMQAEYDAKSIRLSVDFSSAGGDLSYLPPQIYFDLKLGKNATIVIDRRIALDLATLKLDYRLGESDDAIVLGSELLKTSFLAFDVGADSIRILPFEPVRGWVQTVGSTIAMLLVVLLIRWNLGYFYNAFDLYDREFELEVLYQRTLAEICACALCVLSLVVSSTQIDGRFVDSDGGSMPYVVVAAQALQTMGLAACLLADGRFSFWSIVNFFDWIFGQRFGQIVWNLEVTNRKYAAEMNSSGTRNKKLAVLRNFFSCTALSTSIVSISVIRAFDALHSYLAVAFVFVTFYFACRIAFSVSVVVGSSERFYRDVGWMLIVVGSWTWIVSYALLTTWFGTIPLLNLQSIVDDRWSIFGSMILLKSLLAVVVGYHIGEGILSVSGPP